MKTKRRRDRTSGGKGAALVDVHAVIGKKEDGYSIRLLGSLDDYLKSKGVGRPRAGRPLMPADCPEYVRKCLLSCWQRAQDILLGVLQTVVERQKEFLKHGILRLHPLTMTEVAEKIGVHETTVCRAIRGKKVRTPQGVFPLEFFFSPGFNAGDGRSVSNKAIHRMIRMLVGSEDSSHPYSDMQIAEILQGRTIPVMRRTVAKYRGILNIPPSYARKERRAVSKKLSRSSRRRYVSRGGTES